MPKIPYGISHFEKIRNEGYIYVDKTKYIECLEAYGEPYIFFLRPRRFGKTLFLSTLEYYYDVKEKDNFDHLFGGLYISEKKTDLANRYYVLRFDFSGIGTGTRADLLEGFSFIVQESLEDFNKKYGVEIDYIESKQPAIVISDFLSKVKYKIDGKIYVLIDEYDHFANELLGFKADSFEESISKTGFVRIWYDAIKKKTNSIVDRIFATGVSPITLDSMTSGFNIAKNKTRDVHFNEMIGFTEEEVRYLLREVFPDIDINSIIMKLRDYYNGYLFNEKAKERIFNSDMILYYMSEYMINNEEPHLLIDTNISSDYSKLENLFSLKSKERNYRILESILKDELQDVVFTREFNLTNRFNTDDFKSLLFYLGFLTIHDFDGINIRLKVPNYVMKEIYFEFFSRLLEEQMDIELDLSVFRRVTGEIALYGDITNLVKNVESILEMLSNRDYIRFDEKYIKIIILTYLTLSQIYNVKSEYEVEDGYIDIALFNRERQNSRYTVLIELKYIKKKDCDDSGDSIIDRKLSEAKRQLVKYGHAKEFKDMDKLKKWVIVFVGPRAVRVEEVF